MSLEAVPPSSSAGPTRSEATRTKLKQTLARLVVAAGGSSKRRSRLRAFLRVPMPRAVPAPVAASDPRRAALVAAALDLLAPASLHASTYGTPRDVVVADEEIAAIFRAALAMTAQRRTTDRLVRIVVRTAAPTES